MVMSSLCLGSQVEQIRQCIEAVGPKWALSKHWISDVTIDIVITGSELS